MTRAITLLAAPLLWGLTAAGAAFGQSFTLAGPDFPTDARFVVTEEISSRAESHWAPEPAVLQSPGLQGSQETRFTQKITREVLFHGPDSLAVHYVGLSRQVGDAPAVSPALAKLLLASPYEVQMDGAGIRGSRADGSAVSPEELEWLEKDLLHLRSWRDLRAAFPPDGLLPGASVEISGRLLAGLLNETIPPARKAVLRLQTSAGLFVLEVDPETAATVSAPALDYRGSLSLDPSGTRVEINLVSERTALTPIEKSTVSLRSTFKQEIEIRRSIVPREEPQAPAGEQPGGSR